jgi:hypothetical protein
MLNMKFGMDIGKGPNILRSLYALKGRDCPWLGSVQSRSAEHRIGKGSARRPPLYHLTYDCVPLLRDDLSCITDLCFAAAGARTHGGRQWEDGPLDHRWSPSQGDPPRQLKAADPSDRQVLPWPDGCRVARHIQPDEVGPYGPRRR